MNPIFALDLDGTLFGYHRHFLAFANQYFGLRVDAYSYDARLPLHKYLGVSKERYRRCKMAYRRGELKRSIPLLDPPYPNARTLTRTLRQWKCDVWLCTTRPYLAYQEVDDATRESLRRNGVLYQGIMWGEHKYRDLVKQVGAKRIVGVLDDLPAMCQQSDLLGLRTAFALRDHNEKQWAARSGETWSVGIEAVATEEDTLALFRGWLAEWRTP